MTKMQDAVKKLQVDQALVNADIAAISLLANPPPPPAITINTIASAVAGSPQIVSGAYTNAAPTAFTYSIDKGAVVAAVSPTIASGQWSFPIPAPVAGSHTIVVTPNNSAAVTASFVTTAPVSTGIAVTAGPNGDLAHIATAMQGMTAKYFEDGNGIQIPEPLPLVTVTILPAPDGYYDRDCGCMSPIFADHPEIQGLSPHWEQALFGPMTVQGLAGNPPPVLSTLGGDVIPSAVYYSKGFFICEDHAYTFRNLVFRGLRGAYGNRELNGIRIDALTQAATPKTILFQDIWFDDCDTGCLGGSPGQTLIFERCRFTNCGISTGDLAGFTHNVYIGQADSVTFKDCLSTNALVGHLLKSRTHVTFLGTNRLIGDGIPGTTTPCTASYCLDTPCGGTVNIPAGSHLILAMANTPSNGICWHFGGEVSSGDVELPGVINIGGTLTMIGNASQTWTNAYGTTYPIAGFRDDSQSVAGTPKTVFNITGTVEVFNIPTGNEGFPVFTKLTSAPVLDLSSPCLTVVPSV